MNVLVLGVYGGVGGGISFIQLLMICFLAFVRGGGTIVAAMGIFPPVFPWVTEASAETLRT